MPVEHDENGTYIFSSKDLCLNKRNSRNNRYGSRKSKN